MKKIIVLLITFFCLTNLFGQAPRPFPAGLPTCLEDDFRELEKLYDATGGDNWTNKTGWFTNPDLGKWYGIKSPSIACDIEIINLQSNNLQGQLVDLKIPALTTFECSSNQLSGTIPNFANLPNLDFFNCSNNQLSGTIPNFSNLPKLLSLSCQNNNLSGGIPNFTNLPKLSSLSCQNNNLSGGIPNFTNLPKLSSLSCQNNKISGNIPNFTNLPNLESFDFSKNNLTGNIPNFTNLPNLLFINCSNNELAGSFPNFTNLPKLLDLICFNNQLTGTIPNFTNFPKLETFDFSKNNLTGNIPNFTNLPSIKSIKLNSNQLTGTIPNFDSVPSIKSIILDNNQLIGTIPDFTNVPDLNYFSCSNNQLSGNIPDLVNAPSLFNINVTQNFFNFGNVENSKQKLDFISFSPQKTKLPITYKNNLLIGDSAGTTLNKLNYTWFRNDVAFSTTNKNLQSPIITKAGIYYYIVQDSISKSPASIINYISLLSNTITIDATLTGKLFRDLDKNCTFGTNDKPFPNTIIRFENAQDTVYTSTDNQGNYEVILDTFQYNISLKINNLWKSCLLPSVKFSLGMKNKIQDIPMQSVTDCPYLTVDIATQRLLRCFDNTYTVRYDNLGTQSAQNAYILIDFDKYLTVKTATKPFIKLANNRYRFDVGTVDFADPKTFNVVVKVDCDSTVLGQTHCTTAHIYPDSLCVSPPNWDKSSIAVTGNCQNGKVNFDIKNVGKAPTSQPTQYFVIEDQIFTLQSQPFNLLAGEVKNVSLPATGKTYRLVAKQAANHPSGNTFATAAIENCGTAPISFGFVTQYSDGDAEPYLDTDCRQNIGSYDPNEKLASPKGLGTQRLIEKNTDIEYQINFQNEGSDTAYTVVVKDVISKLLNVSTLKMGVSSHPYTWKMDEQGELTVIFDKINLTAKKKDEAKSQGFFKFRISQQKDLPIGTVINNKAGIYFDFNLPIITNTTVHRIGKEYFTVAIPETLENQSLKVNIFPNPFQYSTTFKVESDDDEQFSLQIINTQGSIIHQQAFDEKQLILEKNLPSGIYFYQIKGSKGSVSNGKLLVQ